MNANDAIYLERWIQHREADAFREIVTRYAGMVYGASRRVLGGADGAEDVAQECFQALATAEKVPTSYLGPWLHRVATNLALKKVRADMRRRAREENYAAAQSKMAGISWGDIYEHVDEAIAALPDDLRAPVVAHYLEGYSQTDIAEALGIPRQTITNRVHKGIYEIRKTLRRRGIEVGGIALGTLLVSNLAEAATVPQTLLASMGKLALSGAPLPVGPAGAAPVATAVSLKWILGLGGVLLVGGVLGVLPFIHNSKLRPVQTPATRNLSDPPSAANLDRSATSTQAIPAADRNGTRLPSLNALQTIVSNTIGPGTIQGTVTTGDGSLVAGVQVVLTGIPDDYWRSPDKSLIKKTALTDSQGQYSFSQLPVPYEGIASAYVVHAITPRATAIASANLSTAKCVAQVDLRLADSGMVTGRIVDGEGHGVAGARVFPMPNAEGACEGTSFAYACQANTGNDGAFWLANLPQGAYRVIVMSASYATLESGAFNTGEDPFQLALDHGGSMSGMIVDANAGAPIAGVHVNLGYLCGDSDTRLLLPWNTAFTTTDAGGVYHVDNLRPAAYRASVLSDLEEHFVYPENASARCEFQVVNGENATAPPIRVIRGGVLNGRIVDPGTRRGVAGVPLTLLVRGTSAPLPARACMVTDKDGHFRYTGLPAGEHLLAVDGQVQYAKRFRSAESEIIDDMEVSYARSASISGVVTDASGRPAPGVFVSAESPENVNVPDVLTDRQGRFTVRGLAPSKSAVVLARNNEFDSSLVPCDLLETKHIQGLSLVLSESRTCAIEGIAVDDLGRPVPDLHLYATREGSQGMLPSRGAKTEVDGTFSLDKLSAGSYSIQQSGQPISKSPLRVELAPGEKHTGLRFVASAGDRLEITGRVLSPMRQPLSQAMVSVEHGMESTNERGEFRIQNLEAKQYKISVNYYGYSVTTIDGVQAGTRGVEIVLQELGALAGRVVRADTGQPVPVFEILHQAGDVTRAGDDATGWTRIANENGLFEIDKVNAGDCTVFVRADGLLMASQFANVPPGGTAAGLEIRLETGGHVEGVVRDESGLAVEGAQIFLGEAPSPSGGARVPATVTGPGGQFSLDAIAPETAAITAVYPDYAVGGVPYVEGKSPIQIVLTHGVDVAGSVTVSGEPAAGVSIVLGGPQPGEPVYQRLSARTDEAGQFHFAKVPAGDYVVSVSVKLEGSRQRSITQHISLLPGKPGDVYLDFPSATAAIEGVVRANGTPANKAFVLARIDYATGQEVAVANADETGAFSLPDLPAGAVELQVTQTGAGGTSSRRKSIHIDLADGMTVPVKIDFTGTGAVQGTILGSTGNERVMVALIEGAFQPQFTRTEDVGEVMSAACANAVVNADGTFRVDGLEAGSYTIVMCALSTAKPRPQLLAYATAAVAVSEGATAPVTLRLR